MDNLGHYGLAFDEYTHFTSPIRRYPDLVVHRLLKEISRGSLTTDRIDQLDKVLRKTSDIASKREKLAEEVERESIKIKQAEYMEDKIGDEFDGVISGVVTSGLFVELEDSLIDGLIHISNLTDDYYHFDRERRQLVGERSRRVFRLGLKVKIRVLQADRRLRRIDFTLVHVEDRPKVDAPAVKKIKSETGHGNGSRTGGSKRRKPSRNTRHHRNRRNRRRR